MGLISAACNLSVEINGKSDKILELYNGLVNLPLICEIKNCIKKETQKHCVLKETNYELAIIVNINR